MKVRNFMIPLLLMAAVSCTITPTAAPTLVPKPTRVKPTTTPSPTSAPVTPTAPPTLTLEPTLTPTLVPSLRSRAQACGILIGAAVAPEPMRSERLYAETLAREFSMLTPENAMKFGPVHPGRDVYYFRDADEIVDFAEAHGMQVRGHTLVWHAQLPAWLTGGNWTRNELIEILHEHIATVVGHYQGHVLAWDVVNEAVADDGSLRETIWLQGIGPEYIEMAFRWAHEADPNALLFYNDYNAEGLGNKSDAIYELVQDLVQRGVPIHGVGLQMHVTVDWHPKWQDVVTNTNRLAALGLDVHITEMDVRIKDPVREEELVNQARVYREMLRVCLSAQNCKALALWGFTDRHSWIPFFFEGWDAALIFDKSYCPKPAYYAILDELAECWVEVSSERTEAAEKIYLCLVQREGFNRAGHLGVRAAHAAPVHRGYAMITQPPLAAPPTDLQCYR